jgi:iron complex outermembrane receptor protein
LCFLVLICLLPQPSAWGTDEAQPVARRVLVTDRADRPITGAVVRLAASASSFEATQTTDEHGTAVFPAIDEGTYQLFVTAPGFRAEQLKIAISKSAEPVVVRLQEIFSQRILVTSTLPNGMTEQRMSRDELQELRVSDLAEQMRAVPGLGSIRRGPINQDPWVRGLSEAEIAMFVDGTRTFAAGPCRMDSDISHVSPHRVQAARVVKGPYALTWGSGTLAAVQLETYRPEFSSGPFRTQTRAAVDYTSNADILDAQILSGGSTDTYRFHVFYNDRNGADYEAGDGTIVPGDFRSRDASWSFGLRPGSHTTIEYAGGYQEQEDIDYAGKRMDARYFDTHSHALELTWKPEGVLSEVYGQVSVNDKKHSMNNDDRPTALPDPTRIPPFPTEVEILTDSDTLGGRGHVVLERDAWSWKLGGDFYVTEQSAFRRISRRDTGMVMFENPVWPDAEIRDLGLYGHVKHRGDRVEVNGTLRVDAVAASADATTSFFAQATSGDTDQEETNVSAAVAAGFHLSDHWTARAGVGRAVRTATVLERYADRHPSTKFQINAEFLGDPEIDPEQSLEVDLDLRADYDAVTLDIDLFYRIIEDFITIEPDPNLPPRLPASPPMVYRYVNGDRAVFYGGEARLGQALGGGFSWRTSVSYVRAEDTTFDEPVLGIVPLWVEVGGRYRSSGPRPLWIDLAAILVAEQDRVATSRFEQATPGYGIVNVRGGVLLAPSLNLKFGIENLADRAYATHLNAVDPFTGERVLEIGRRVYAGVAYDF